jgi:hypothetical protein
MCKRVTACYKGIHKPTNCNSLCDWQCVTLTPCVLDPVVTYCVVSAWLSHSHHQLRWKLDGMKHCLCAQIFSVKVSSERSFELQKAAVPLSPHMQLWRHLHHMALLSLVGCRVTYIEMDSYVWLARQTGKFPKLWGPTSCDVSYMASEQNTMTAKTYCRNILTGRLIALRMHRNCRAVCECRGSGCASSWFEWCARS